MPSILESKILGSLTQAGLFFERSAIKVPASDGSELYGYPEVLGRGRITECGGTSSALAGLAMIGTSSKAHEKHAESALAWLLSRQQDGAWEAGRVYSSDVTTMIMLDLARTDELNHAQSRAGVEFVELCRMGGSYASRPGADATPHIFTTYVCVRCVATYARVKAPDQIRAWLDSAKTATGRWGVAFKDDRDTPAHTAYALWALKDCLGSWDMVKHEYPRQVAWLRKQMRCSDYEYEFISMPTNERDAEGQPVYTRMRLGHYTTAVVGQTLVELGFNQEAMYLARRILSSQWTGGWGHSNDELTMWATYHAGAFLHDVRERVLPEARWLAEALSLYVAAFSLVVDAVAVAALTGIVVSAVAFTAYRAEMIISGAVVVAGWAINRVLRYVR